jgi:hypothetical protein
VDCARFRVFVGALPIVYLLLGPAMAFAAAPVSQAATASGTPAPGAVVGTTVGSSLLIGAVGVFGAIIGGIFTLVATRMTGQSSRALERHKFRYEIGRIAAEKRLQAYIDLAAHACLAYRKRFSTDWSTGEWKDSYHLFANYYYDNRFFFSQSLGESFGNLKQSLNVEYPKREIVEQHLNAFFDTVSADLLLADLEESARRAVKAAVTLPE